MKPEILQNYCVGMSIGMLSLNIYSFAKTCLSWFKGSW